MSLSKRPESPRAHWALWMLKSNGLSPILAKSDLTVPVVALPRFDSAAAGHAVGQNWGERSRRAGRGNDALDGKIVEVANEALEFAEHADDVSMRQRLAGASRSAGSRYPSYTCVASSENIDPG